MRKIMIMGAGAQGSTIAMKMQEEPGIEEDIAVHQDESSGRGLPGQPERVDRVRRGVVGVQQVVDRRSGGCANNGLGMTREHGDPFYPRRPERAHLVVEERPASDLEHALGDVAREIAEPAALAGGQDDGPHDSVRKPSILVVSDPDRTFWQGPHLHRE